MKRPVPLIAAAAIAAGIGGAVFLSFADGGKGKADPDNPAQVALGAKVYAAHSAACHGADLEGQPNWQTPLADGGYPAPPHDETGHTGHHPDALLFQVIKRGGQSAAPAGFQSNMPGFAEALSDTEIWAALAFIKNRWPQEVRMRKAKIDAQSR